MYTPRPASELLRDLAARMVARSELTDISEGSVLYDLLATFAEQVAEADARLAQVRAQFTLEGASGADLDERADELGITRLPATRATGTLTVTRASGTGSFTLPAGSLFGRLDSSVTYATTQDVTMLAGTTSALAPVRASVAGAAGNVGSRGVSVILSAEGIVGVVQGSPIANGQDAESDAALRGRATRYLNSLARCQPSALEYAALSFTASDNTRATTVTCYEDPVRLGRVELLVDDGSGLGDAPLTRLGASTSHLVTSAGSFIVGAERAMVSAPSVTRVRGGASTPLIEGVDYAVSLGRGIVTVLEAADVAVDDLLNVSSYYVYTGLVGELQALVEGVAGDVTSGYRAAGTSLRVLPAPVQRVDVDLLITTVEGGDVTAITEDVERAVAQYLATLGAGAPAYIARMVEASLSVGGVLNVRVLRPDSSALAVDQYPNTTRTVLRAGQVRAITSTTGA